MGELSAVSSGGRCDCGMAEIITAAVTGCVTLIGVLLSNRAAQAVTDEKLAELTQRSTGAQRICPADACS